eukprot:m.1469258 g.1469258  ORF g.1469258 m.1469258 type:complete len:52 (-) comp25141_c0_seq2:261-416(-)
MLMCVQDAGAVVPIVVLTLKVCLLLGHSENDESIVKSVFKDAALMNAVIVS